jgi:hypothetical protein
MGERQQLFSGFHLFRSACILQGILGRVRDGTAASEHPSRIAEGIGPLAKAAWAVAQELGA